MKAKNNTIADYNTLPKTNIILFGKNGQVASDLITIFATKPDFNIHNYSSKNIDFTDIATLKRKLVDLPKADFIINATAYNAVDKAEDEANIANLINHLAVKEIADYCQQQQIIFIHYSTNYVFDGKSDKPNKEDDYQNLKPISIYGKTKLDGEKAIMNSHCDYFILRVATVFNPSKENNFVAKIKKLSKNNNELKIVDDQITNPTNSFDIAKATIDIIEKIIQKKQMQKKYEHNNSQQNLHNLQNLDNKQNHTAKYQFASKIYHLASKEPVSYYQFAKKITANMQKNIIITPVATKYFPTKASRPLNGALDVSKIKQDFAIEIKEIDIDS